MKKILTIQTLLIVGIILLPVLVHAQNYGDDTGDAPVDGGLSLLIAAGTGYGLKKLKDRNTKNK